MEDLKSLILRSQAGDLEAFGKLVQRFQDMAVGYAYSILDDFHLAEDAAQEAFIEAYSHLHQLREPESFPSWFRKVVFKYCDRLTRRRRAETLPLETAVEMPSRAKGPEEAVEEQEMKDLVLAAIKALPEKERLVTTLFYINGYSHEEIADFLEVPAATVNNRLRTSRKRIKERMITIMVRQKSFDEIALIRKSGNAVSEVLEEIGKSIKEGISTYELDTIAKDAIKAKNALPAFLGYRIPNHLPYPGAICASINEEVVHGVPSKNQKLKNGDIISIDVGLVLNGYYGDIAFTFPVGNIPSKARHLIDVTYAALYEGIKVAKPGNRIGDIAFAVQSYVESNGYSVVRDFVGHGIGKSLHEDPKVPNFGEPEKGPRLKPGMVIAIEPIVNSENPDVKVLDDGWTVVSSDGSLSAHFEHMVAILSDGSEILTWF